MSWPTDSAKKAPPLFQRDGDEPGQHDGRVTSAPAPRTQAQKPARLSAPGTQSTSGREAGEHHDQRSLDRGCRRRSRARTARHGRAGEHAGRRGSDRRGRAPPMAATEQAVSTASVLARRASTIRMIEAAMKAAARNAPRLADEGERRPIGQQHRRDARRAARECGRGRSWCAPPARRAPPRGRRRRSAASRCRPASCAGPRPGSGCRRSPPLSSICFDACAIARLVPVHRLEGGEARQEAGEREQHEDGAEAGMAPLDDVRQLGHGEDGARHPLLGDRTVHQRLRRRQQAFVPGGCPRGTGPSSRGCPLNPA